MNILVIEDELIALEELELLLKAFEPEHTINGAPNGVEALELAKRVRPDLVVTDIRMPGIDGLEVIRELKRRFPGTEAIVISGYDDFAYARTGLQLGVKDYLVKPVKRKALMETVGAVLEQLAVKRQQERKAEQWKTIRALEGRQQEAEEPEVLAGKWLMIVSVLGNWNAAKAWADHESMIGGICAELGPDAHVVYPASNRQCILLPWLQGKPEQAVRSQIYRLHTAYAKTKENVHTAAVVKEAHERPEAAFARAAAMLERQIRLGGGTLSYMEAGRHTADTSGVWNHIRLLEAHLAKRDMKHIRAQIDRILFQIETLQLPVKTIGHLLNDMFTALQFKLLQGWTYQIADLGAIKEILSGITGYRELGDWLEKRLLEFVWELGSEGKEPRDLVHKLMNRIRQAYDSIDSLHQFAREHHISVSYLSRLFKTEAGMNFSDYLIQVRMEQAKLLLASETLSVIEVSARVGYEDSKYFSQLFKKCTGKTPSDFQKSNKIVPPK